MDPPLVDVVCPRCTTIVHARPGTFARCPRCDYMGGSVPGANEVQVFTPPHEFLPSDPFPQEKEEEEEQAPPKETSRVALTALVLGFAGILIPFAPPVAVGFGIGGIVHINKNPDEFRGKGLAVIGIVFGVLTSIMWVMFIVMIAAGTGRAIYGQ